MCPRLPGPFTPVSLKMPFLVVLSSIQRTPTNENNGGTEWQGIQQLLLMLDNFRSYLLADGHVLQKKILTNISIAFLQFQLCSTRFDEFSQKLNQHFKWLFCMLRALSCTCAAAMCFMLKFSLRRIWQASTPCMCSVMFRGQALSYIVWLPNMVMLKQMAKRLKPGAHYLLKHVWSNETIDASRWASVVRMPSSNMFDTRLSKRTKHCQSNTRTKQMF